MPATMKIAETVTFGGSGLDRAAELRGDAVAQQVLAASSAAAVLLFWKGKPLIEGEGETALVRLPATHPILRNAAQSRIFLGRDGDVAYFAADLAGWEPEDLDFSTLGTFLDPSRQAHPDLPASQCFAELRVIMTHLAPRDAELAATAKAVMSWHDGHGFCARCGAATVMTMAGWQRDCPACGGHHFPRTDPVVIMLVTRGNSVLLGRSPGWPEGMYSLLAGFVEPGETIEAAVRREVFEEAGVRVGEVGYLASQPWPFPASLMFGCRGQATSDTITVDPNELEDARWVTREDLVQVFAGEHPVIRPARRGAIAHFLMSNWLADRLD